MITEGEAPIPLETTWRAFRNQEKSKQRSVIESVTKKPELQIFFSYYELVISF